MATLRACALADVIAPVRVDDLADEDPFLASMRREPLPRRPKAPNAIRRKSDLVRQEIRWKKHSSGGSGVFTSPLVFRKRFHRLPAGFTLLACVLVN